MSLDVTPRILPPLDPAFQPAVLWNRAFLHRVAEYGRADNLALALSRPNGSVSVYHTRLFPEDAGFSRLNERYVERLLKFLLWQRGGSHITVAGSPSIAHYLRRTYAPDGERAFDFDFIGQRVYGRPLTFESVDYSETPDAREGGSSLGRHWDGCRIGFDLGGSDRKCAAVIEGEVVHTEEVVWDPYFEQDPEYHSREINDSLRRAADRLPRVDAIGGSSAGVYIDNEVRVASLFRGVSPDLFEKRVRRIFFDLQREWSGVPFVVANDGEVTALAGSMSLEANGVLGISMGTSQAGGYVTASGNITDWLNELAFAPIDYRPDAPRDEWSGDAGAGAQYFSQQAVGRLMPVAGIEAPTPSPFQGEGWGEVSGTSPEMTLPERLVLAQTMLEAGDPRARAIFETIGVYAGYAIAHYADFYDLRHVLVLGRVTSGLAGEIILDRARDVLHAEFPDLSDRIELHLPSEQDKRHGQAVAAASLPFVRH